MSNCLLADIGGTRTRTGLGARSNDRHAKRPLSRLSRRAFAYAAPADDAIHPHRAYRLFMKKSTASVGFTPSLIVQAVG